jgi:hypothetical protein
MADQGTSQWRGKGQRGVSRVQPTGITSSGSEGSFAPLASDGPYKGLIGTSRLDRSRTIAVATIVAQVYTASAAETLTLSESVQFARAASVAETLSRVEALSAVSDKPVSPAETLSLSEAAVGDRALLPIVSETLSLSEGATDDRTLRPLVSETLSLSEGATGDRSVRPALAETLTLSEGSSSHVVATQSLPVTQPFGESLAAANGKAYQLEETLTLSEVFQAAQFAVVATSGTSFVATFPEPVRYDGVADKDHYEVVPVNGGVPISIVSIEPTVETYAVATNGTVVAVGNTLRSTRLHLSTIGFTQDSVGDYISITNSGLNRITQARIVNVVDSHTIEIDRLLLLSDPNNGSLIVTYTSAVLSVTVKTTRMTGNKNYRLTVRGLQPKAQHRYFSASSEFVSNSPKPTLTNVSFEADQVVLTFSAPMRSDMALTDPAEYSILGPTPVTIQGVLPLSSQQVALLTNGLGVGSYQVVVNASGTPKDEAGNPIDPVYNTAIFESSEPLLTRSVFTDKGPIAKPSEVVQSGSGVTFKTYTTTTFGPTTFFTSDQVELTGASLTPDHVGLYVEITGSERNDGTYRVSAVKANGGGFFTVAKLQASFSLPDTATAGTIGWKLVDPRHGQIADDPSDVVVRVNGVPVVPEAVIGLLGQVVLPSTPGPADDVMVDYAWVRNPTVDFRRLNSHEFTLNAWSHDQQSSSPSRHAYRYRTALVDPGEFVADDMQATLDEPLLRDLFYRAYERAYSALLNEPDRLLLNTPSHRIAYPPLAREVASVSVAYMADTLPEADSWTRKGSGVATVASGVLTATDNTTGPFPGGQPLYWTRDLDLSFPHVFAATWRMAIPTVTTLDGVFTGQAVGWSNNKRAVVLGYLDDGDGRKLGLLRQGYGNDSSLLAAWAGGVAGDGSATGLPADFDWSIVHSYRFFRGADGVVRVYVDGEVTEILRLSEDELPFLEELNDPFDSLQGFFFGSLSRPAESTATWDFVRYLVLPTNPIQTAPSLFVDYEANALPEQDVLSPWTPVGYHGTERLSEGDFLVLDSTSASDASGVGLVGGDFHGFTRVEPLLSEATQVVLDARLRVQNHTHGADPNAVMIAVDDGNRLMQLSFFSLHEKPKVSYPGRSLPEEASPKAWTAFGGAGARMIGRTLRIEDNTASDGRIYYVEDLASPGSETRIIGSLADYVLEARVRVVSYSPDPSPVGFCGVTADVFDGLRSVGLLLREDSGTKYVSLHSEGTPLADFAFDWNDGKFHTYRLTKSSSLGTLVLEGANGTILGDSLSDPAGFAGVLPGDHVVVYSGSSAGVYPVVFVSGTDLNLATPALPGSNLYYEIRRSKSLTVSAFVDGELLGTYDYDSFANSLGVATISFGSATAVTMGAQSEVDWAYVNVWRTVNLDEGEDPKYIGLWRGEEGDSLLGYHLPTKVQGFAESSTYRQYLYTGGGGSVLGTAFSAFSANFPMAGVQSGDILHIGSGPAAGSYPILSVATSALTLATPAPTDNAFGFEIYRILANNNEIESQSINFLTAGVVEGDWLVVDDGPNRGSYKIIVVAAHQVAVSPSFPVGNAALRYRIPKPIDWTSYTQLRLVRTPGGEVSVFFNGEATPGISVPYSEVALPSRSVGVPGQINRTLPSVTWGAFSSSELSQSSWDYLRYGVVRSLGEARIVPERHALNERNVMSSPEHLSGVVAHDHTQFSASSTGVPYPWEEFVENPAVTAHTRLNEGTPLVPQTQTYEVRRPTPMLTFTAGLNNPEDVLNSHTGFLLNDATAEVQILVPNDVLYSSLQVIERAEGEEDLLTPFQDGEGVVAINQVAFRGEVCMVYEGDKLPEQDTSVSPPWVLASTTPSDVTASVSAGVLSYGVGPGGSQTLYRNYTTLPDASLDTVVTFRLRIANDASGGTGDTGVRVGFSAFGLTAALAFVTNSLGEREIQMLDLNSGEVFGGVLFDFLDGAFHVYQLTKNVTLGTIDLVIDP